MKGIPGMRFAHYIRYRIYFFFITITESIPLLMGY